MSKRDSLENFTEKLNELINSKYILAGGKVGDVLKAIASSDILYELFAYITENFDYKTYKGLCFTSPDSGRGSFKMPAKDEDAMALVFLLLMEIEAKKEDMFILCDKYFYTPEGKQQCYGKFCEQVLLPFREIVEKTVYKLVNEDFPIDDAPEKENVKEDTKVEGKDDFAEIAAVVERERKKIGFNKKLTPDFIEEIDFVLDRLLLAVKCGDREDIAAMFIALKYMDKSNRKAKIDLEEIAKELREKAL